MAKQDKKARAANRLMFGHASIEPDAKRIAEYKSLEPRRNSRSFHKIIDELDKQLQESEGKLQGPVSRSHFDVFKRAYTLALRDNMEDIDSIQCPKCQSYHPISCPDCGPHTIKYPNVAREKNSIEALKILANKMAPNLAAVTTDINITMTLTRIQDTIIHVITHYVPAEHRHEALADVQSSLGNIYGENATG